MSRPARLKYAAEADSTRWRDDANCIGVDTEIFFPGTGVNPHQARAIRAACTVRDECLAFALANHPLDGIFAGTTMLERRELLAERRRATW